MAKTKKDSIDITRSSEELRDIKVEMDFTTNALSSILYSQGNTKILACVTKALLYQDGFLGMRIRGGFMLNIPYYLVRQIQDSGESVLGRKGGLKRLRG